VFSTFSTFRVDVNQDSNTTRRKLQQQDASLVLRYLKKDLHNFQMLQAIYRNPKKSPRKSVQTTASSRRERAMKDKEMLKDSFRACVDIFNLPLDVLERPLMDETKLGLLAFEQP